MSCGPEGLRSHERGRKKTFSADSSAMEKLADRVSCGDPQGRGKGATASYPQQAGFAPFTSFSHLAPTSASAADGCVSAWEHFDSVEGLQIIIGGVVKECDPFCCRYRLTSGGPCIAIHIFSTVELIAHSWFAFKTNPCPLFIQRNIQK